MLGHAASPLSQYGAGDRLQQCEVTAQRLSPFLLPLLIRFPFFFFFLSLLPFPFYTSPRFTYSGFQRWRSH